MTDHATASRFEENGRVQQGCDRLQGGPVSPVRATAGTAGDIAAHRRSRPGVPAC